MYRKVKAVSGVRRCLKDWRKAVVALLEPAPNTDLPPLSQRVAALKELVRTDQTWKAKVRAFFAELDREVAQAEMTRLGLQPAEQQAAPYPELTAEQLAAIEKLMNTPNPEVLNA